jgi:N-acetylglutamate synthase-like GNAT family acetyltransferase
MKTFINNTAYLNKGYIISTDKSLIDLDYIFNFLTEESYWAKGISKAIFKKSIENSICFSIYLKNEQIGFARVITDYATFAYLADVFIDKNHRKKGLSKWLVQNILDYDQLQNLRLWLLATADAHQLYQQFGFVSLNNPQRFMQIFKPYQESNHVK